MAFLFLTVTSGASVFFRDPAEDRLAFDTQDRLRVCWWGPASPEGLTLRRKIETYLRAQLEVRAGIKIEIAEDCFRELDSFFPVGIAFYDDPQTPESLRTEIRQFHEANGPFGHPVTFYRGAWANKGMVDINLTTRFEEVDEGLRRQAEPLTPLGRENLLLSIALHELLHALGFAHEQTHRDSICTEGNESYNSSIHTLITDYDPQSIMNYCLTHHFDFERGPLPLSILDLEGLRRVYKGSDL